MYGHFYVIPMRILSYKKHISRPAGAAGKMKSYDIGDGGGTSTPNLINISLFVCVPGSSRLLSVPGLRDEEFEIGVAD